MKFGNKDFFQDFHRDENCKGDWVLVEKNNVPYRMDSGILVILNHAPFVKCNKCAATFFAQGYEQWLKQLIAKMLLAQDGLLDKAELRFLRNIVGKTQKEMAGYLGWNVDEYTKFESENSDRKLNLDRNARIKMIFADLLDIKDPELLRKLAYVNKDKKVELPKYIDSTEYKNLISAS